MLLDILSLCASACYLGKPVFCGIIGHVRAANRRVFYVRLSVGLSACLTLARVSVCRPPVCLIDRLSAACRAFCFSERDSARCGRCSSGLDPSTLGFLRVRGHGRDFSLPVADAGCFLSDARVVFLLLLGSHVGLLLKHQRPTLKQLLVGVFSSTGD